MGRNDRQNAYNQQTQRFQSQQQAAQDQITSIPGDLTPQQKAAMTQDTLGAIDTNYQNTKDELFRRASATGSSSGINDIVAEEGRAAGREKASQTAALEMNMANIPVQRAMEKAGLYIPLAGQSSSAMGQVAPQPSKGIFGSIMKGVSGAGEAIAGGLTGNPAMVMQGAGTFSGAF